MAYSPASSLRQSARRTQQRPLSAQPNTRPCGACLHLEPCLPRHGSAGRRAPAPAWMPAA